MNILRQIVKDAEKKKVAIGHFNISTHEQLKAIAHVALRMDVPVIIGVSEGERQYLGIQHARDFISSYNKAHGDEGGFWMFLNADHSHSLLDVKLLAEVGFDTILFDGGKLPMEENIKQTAEAVRIAKFTNRDILVEGELGNIGSASEVRVALPEGAAVKSEDLTNPEQALAFVRDTKVDMLAPAVGNIHGMFKDAPEPRLDIERIRAIKQAVSIPLVLHGASGNTHDDIRAAIDAGISIVHISTELRVAWRQGIETALKQFPDEVAPYKIMPTAVEAMEKVVEEKLKLFNHL